MSENAELLKRLEGLVCPETQESLIFKNGNLSTADERHNYPVYEDGTIDFLGRRQMNELVRKRDAVDKVKALIKRFTGTKFNLIKSIISPVMPNIHWKKLELHRTRLIREYILPAERALNIGSGNNRISEKVLNLDIFDYPGVDIIADCRQLPYPDESVDAVMSMAVLEHVPSPEALLKDAVRVLKPGGIILTGVPFIEGFHASPFDFYRWTKKGLVEMHNRYGISEIEIVPLGGPTSSLVWIAIEWLAMAVSLNTKPLYYLGFFVFSILLFPLKIIDLILVHHPEADKINTFFIFVGRKSTDGSSK